MSLRTFTLACCIAVAAQAVIIDRVAIQAGNSIIKDSDIVRDIRLTDFLNGEQLDLGAAARKTAASRLIDQVFIRREIRIGDYPTASLDQAKKQIDALEGKRYKTAAALQEALARYGLTEADLQMHLQWQLTVLNFIDARFKPAAYISDDEIEKYYNSHRSELQNQNPGKTTLNDLRPVIQSSLSAQKVNQIFFAWLNEQRQNNKVHYLEASLQ
jgi:hypothetical protein